MIENKTEYLIKTFARMQNKGFENFVINTIWNNIDNLNLRPITQQCVKKSENHYYLIDLYFPQINVAIEVDEKYHTDSKQKNLDKIRSDEIYTAVKEKDLQILRVKYSDKITEVYKQIKSHTETIKERIKNKIFCWDLKDEFDEEIKKIQETGHIKISDAIKFPYKCDILNNLFNFDIKYTKNFVQGWKTHVDNKDRIVWFPQPEITGYYNKNNKWDNLLSNDFERIVDKPKDVKVKNNDYANNAERIIFVKVKNKIGEIFYKFIGIYKPVEVLGNQITLARISTEYNFNEKNS